MALQRVETDAIQDDAVTTAKIAAGAVSAADIAADAITNIKVAAGAAIAVSKITGLGTAAALNTGTGANNVVQLDGSGRLPAVSGANLSGVSTDTSAMENNIAILAFKTQSANNLAKFNLIDQVIDEYKDGTGVTLTTAGQTGSTATDGYLSSISTGVGAFTSDSDTKFLIHMEDTALVDSGPSAITPTIVGTAARSSVQNKIGTYSVLLDGNSDYMKYGNWTPAVGTGDFTIEAWIWPVSPYSGNQHIAGTRTTGGASVLHWGIYMDGNRKITFGNSGAILGLFSTAVTGGAWNHVAVSRTGSAVKGYLNGVQDMSITAANDFSQVNEFWVGYSTVDGTYFNGYIDEVRASTIGRYTTNFTSNSVTTTSATGTAISTANTALTAPTTGDIVLLIENASGTATLNTDLKAFVSRNGGTGWDQVTLADKGSWGTNKKILTANNVAFSNSASGTDMRYKIEWANQASGTKETRVHATSLAWA